MEASRSGSTGMDMISSLNRGVACGNTDLDLQQNFGLYEYE